MSMTAFSDVMGTNLTKGRQAGWLAVDRGVKGFFRGASSATAALGALRMRWPLLALAHFAHC